MGLCFAYVVITSITDTSMYQEYFTGPVCYSILYPWGSWVLFSGLLPYGGKVVAQFQTSHLHLWQEKR